MNIGIVTTWFERGAAYVSKQIENTLSKEHQVYIYARGGEKYEKGNPNWDKENVTWGKRTAFSGPTSINHNDFLKWLKNKNIKIVIFNEQHDWGILSICHNLNIKIGSYIDYYKKETVRFFASYDFLICNTKRHYSVFDWHPQCLYIPWGTDIELFKPREKESAEFTFFHSAGFNPLRKGTDILLKAAYEIKDKPIKTIIHTQKDLLSFFPNLRNVIIDLKKSNRLQIINMTVTAPGLYHLGDVYVYPSRLEGIGLTIAEAISCGLPVIVTDEQPMNEFIGSQYAGTTIKVKEKSYRNDGYYWPQAIADVQDLKNKMLSLYEKRDEYSFKKKAREYAIKHLDWEVNSYPLNEQLQNLKLLDSSFKKNAIAEAKRYDKNISFIKKIRGSRIYKNIRNIILEHFYKK
jgi:1,2-diacylglycerol 3-alpha-glucosyltransferase